MIQAMVLVLALAVLGDTLADALGAPVPGATIGLLLLAASFGARGGPDRGSTALFEGVAPHFPLFFIPAASGLVASADLLASAWLSVVTAILASTIAAIAITGLVVQGALRVVQKEETG